MSQNQERSRSSRRSDRPGILLVVTLFVGLLGGCTQTKTFLASDGAPRHDGPRRVLLMPPDVELYELTAAGLLEPNAAWTENATTHIEQAVSSVLAGKQAELVHYPATAEAEGVEDPHVQILKLHGAVGNSILLHKFVAEAELPTKKDRFDWSLGEGVSVLRESYGADYALFLYFRESFASAGRVALIFVGALFGAALPGGVQSGFASLVDLRTGDILWFSRLVSETGDLRKPDLAHKATVSLLSGLPL